MKQVGNILLALLLCCSISMKVGAQSADLNQRVSWEYLDVRLEDALFGISQAYDIRFSYSAYYIPVDRIISTKVSNESLQKALDDLFENTGVIYKSIGDQVVLRVSDQNRQKRSISYNTKPQPKTPKETKTEEEITSSTTTILTPVPKTRKQPIPAELEDKDDYIFQAPKVAKEETNPTRYEYHGRARSKIPQAISPVDIMPVTIADFAEDNGIGRKKGLEIDLTKYKLFIEKIEIRIAEQLAKTEEVAENAWVNITVNLEQQKTKRKAKREERRQSKAEKELKKNKKQTLVAEQGISEEEEEDTTSETIIEEGEIETLGEAYEDRKEEIELEERFVQVSVVPFVGTNFLKSRKVENKVSANILWGVNGGVEGVELGGLVNSVRKDVNGVQAAGLGNLVRGEVNGVQAAGLLNVSGKGGKNVQVAGLVNYAGGDAGLQVAGLSNVSKDKVATAQISAIFNKATYVKGVQIGLINVVDSIGIAPIGLINIVKSGKNKYNKVELATSEVFEGIFELKFGAKRLYNILHGGYKWDQDANSWAIGFGIGTAFEWGRRSLLNLEVIAMHVNEKEDFTTDLNLLNQLKLTYNLKVWGGMNIFVGPTFNVFVSNRFNSDTGEYGTELAPSNVLFDENRFNTVGVPPIQVNQFNTKGWVGFTAGIRF